MSLLEGGEERYIQAIIISDSIDSLMTRRAEFKKRRRLEPFKKHVCLILVRSTHQSLLCIFSSYLKEREREREREGGGGFGHRSIKTTDNENEIFLC